MKPSQAITLLRAAMRRRAPILLTGGPGVGKTSVGFQAAAEESFEVVVSTPSIEDPTDNKGIPFPDKSGKSARFLPIGHIAQVLAATSDTLWFIDDLGQALPSVQAPLMQWLLLRECAGNKLPDCVSVMAATNRRTDRANVTGLLEPVKSRFVTIVELTPDLDDWTAWAFADGNVPPELIAFLRFRPDLLNAFQPSADLTNSPTPRTWGRSAAEILNMKLPPAIESEALAGAVGGGGATELLAFLRMFRELPNIDGIQVNPDAAIIPTNPAALYATAAALAMRVTEQTFDRVGRYIERLVAAQHAEFGAFFLTGAIKRTPGVQNTAMFNKLMAGDLGKILSGTN